MFDTPPGCPAPHTGCSSLSYCNQKDRKKGNSFEITMSCSPGGIHSHSNGTRASPQLQPHTQNDSIRTASGWAHISSSLKHFTHRCTKFMLQVSCSSQVPDMGIHRVLLRSTLCTTATSLTVPPSRPNTYLQATHISGRVRRCAALWERAGCGCAPLARAIEQGCMRHACSGYKVNYPRCDHAAWKSRRLHSCQKHRYLSSPAFVACEEEHRGSVVPEGTTQLHRCLGRQNHGRKCT